MESPESKVSRFKDKKMDFSECFAYCSSDGGVINYGTVPALWEYSMDNSSLTSKCFIGVRNKVTNASSIPDNWKK